MPPKHPATPGEGQLALLDMGPEPGSVYAHTFDVAPAQDASSPVVAVDMLARNLNLQFALRLLGEVSQRTGLSIAAEDNTHRRELAARYENVDRVVRGAQTKSEGMQQEVKEKLACTIGIVAMQDAGMISGNEAKKLLDEAYRSFVRTYGDSHNRTRRDSYKQQLGRAERVMTGKTVRRKRVSAAS